MEHELNYRLNKNQSALICTLKDSGRSWVLRRYQGTGCRFWRISVTSKPDWEGEWLEVDGRTVKEVVENTVIQMERFKP